MVEPFRKPIARFGGTCARAPSDPPAGGESEPDAGQQARRRLRACGQAPEPLLRMALNALLPPGAIVSAVYDPPGVPAAWAADIVGRRVAWVAHPDGRRDLDPGLWAMTPYPCRAGDVRSMRQVALGHLRDIDVIGSADAPDARLALLPARQDCSRQGERAMPLLKGPGSPLALAFAVALAGCGGGSSSSEGGSSSADSASSSGSSSSGSSSGSSGSSATSAGTGTSAVVTAAGAFLSTLGNSQKTVAGSTGSTSTVLFNLTRDNAIQWTNLPGSRHGLRLNTSTLTTAQLQAAETLMTTALSTAGKAEQDEIRAADDVLAASAGGYGSGLYSIAILGTPSTTSPWMLQIIGHHLAYNITYNGAYVSGTPAFLGVEPPNWVVTSSGSVVVNATASTAGTQHAPLETQRAALAALATALQANSTYKSGALLSGTYNDVVAGANGNTDSNFGALAYPTSGRGLLYASLDATAQGHVKAAIEAYVKTMPGDIADTLLATYESDTALAQTYVGYSPGQGGTADFGAYPNAQATPTSAQRSYIRIDGPRLWIEFVVQQGAVYRNYVHYHGIWRDKVADYGGQFGSGG